MGRPEACVLFAQTFVHSQLDEYVDEVIFAEPIVISACEFLEQNASSVSPAIPLLGATSPPSFALEVFVQCEGETRFRRLCQPFLYSHSSSNVLEVEAVVTSHLVVRGSYRSLSLVIYGNTAEDLGQFNIGFDLDSSLSNLVCCTEPKLEDLPPLFKSNNPTLEDFITPPNALSLSVAVSDISVEAKQLLQLLFKILELSDLGDAELKVASSVVSAASSCVSYDTQSTFQKQLMQLRFECCSDDSKRIISDARKELLDLYGILHDESRNASDRESVDFSFMESEADLASPKDLVGMFNQYIYFIRNSSNVEHSHLSQSMSVILGLSVAFLLCSGRDSCLHFVNDIGMEQLACVLPDDSQNSSAITLLLLGVVEQATRYSVGCEGFLGWWPREDENIPAGTSEGYNHLLKLLLQKQSHGVASLATYILHRLRFYEVISRYECAVLSILGGLSADGGVTSVTLEMLINAKMQLRKLLNLINSRVLVDDPSPVARASRSLMVGQTEGLLSYKATSGLIATSSCCFSYADIDSHFLALIKERGFLPLSAALLASPILRTEEGLAIDMFVDVVSCLEAIILSLLFCRSGLIFLLLHRDLSATLILALRGADDMNKEECIPPRYASVLMSKGFFCDPLDIGIIVETHLRVVSAIDRLLASTPHSEEFLWVLWELCGLSRFECGRQALLALEHFPEALLILMGALHSAKELEPATLNTGTSHLNLAIFHSAAEIFEVIVTDSAASSLASWIEHAVELHRTLHSSSHGSNRKDAPTRLLEWIDAGVIYHKNGATGLLQYAAVLASGGDAHLTSTSILVSDSMEIDNVVGEASSGSDTHVVENLGKVISDKTFDGVSLLDSSVAQLTTAFRILAFISENPVVAAALYDEGAMTVIYAVLVNCRFMLERSSNSYDYLVDEGTECNSTSDLLLERNREKSLIDLLLPCLVLLIIILQRLQEANEQHRNKKLMNALLRLHREVSPRLAACAADVSSPYPDSALGLEAVCHLIVSALACWPIYGWTPGLFRSLLASVHATSLLVLGPKETCSFLCLLNDLLPEEGILMWKNGMPLLSAFRTLAIGSLLGPQKERQVNWYLQPVHVEVLLNQLMPQLDKIAQIVLHNAITSLVVIQDMLRVFIIRLACQKAENTSLLLRPIISWIRGHLSEFSPSDTDSYKVYRLLNFLASLLEHPQAKPLLLKEGAVPMLVEVLERCTESSGSDGKKFLDGTSLAKCGFTLLSWSLPVFKSISLICNCRPSAHVHGHDMGSLSTEDCSSILTMILRLCEALPVGRELVECLSAFKDLGSCSEGHAALLAIYLRNNSLIVEDLEIKRINARDVDSAMFNEYERIKHPPLLSCWIKLLTSILSNDSTSSYAIDAVGVMSSSALCICMDGKSLHVDRVAAMKHLFGLPDDTNGRDHFPKENIKYIQDMANLLCSRIADANPSNLNAHLYQVSKTVKSLLLLLQEPTSSVNVDDVISGEDVSLSSNDLVSSKLRLMADGSAEACDYSFLGDFGEKFSWECPESLPDRLSQAALPAKRKLSSLESLNKRASRDNSSTEIVAQNVFSRGSGLSTAPPGPSRRDTFRQRKPNTSRPPSMHVDDYVARERNVDGATNSNVISVQRVGSTSGRPPSIHVDEFMARQRERQNPIAASTVETAGQSKSTENKTDMEKSIKSKPLKPELDDDLQGIDIVFDGEESESDDKLPFPQPDDNLQQLPPVIVAQSSPNYIAEETQSESSASCDKKLFDQPDDSRNVTRVMASGTSDSSVVASSPDFSTSVYMNTSATSMMPPSNNIYMRSNLQQAGPVASVTGSPGIYDRKFLPNQPPLPPFPPSQPGISQLADPVPSHSSPFVNSITDVQLVQPTAFHVRASEYMSAFNNNPTSLSPSFPVPDPKYAKTSMASPVISARPPPPPPTPPPFPSAQFSSPFYNQPGVGTTELPQSSSAPLSDARLSNFAASAARLATYPPPPLAPPLPFSRPASMALNMHTNPTQQQGELFSSILQNLPIPQVSLQSVQPLGQLQPLQPPQLIRPPQPPQHPRLPVQVSQQVEQGPPVMQSPAQMQVPQLQMLHPPQVSPVPVYYQPQQAENMSNTQQQQPVENAQAQVVRQQGDGASRQQDMGMSLQDYFSSPEAIQSLLSDREKLCQLLEEHPKLMQMLQERLGQL